MVDTRTGEARAIDVPESTVPRHLSWATGHTLMFLAATSGGGSAGSVVACNADTAQCASVAELDDVDQVVLPRL